MPETTQALKPSALDRTLQWEETKQKLSVPLKPVQFAETQHTVFFYFSTFHVPK